MPKECQKLYRLYFKNREQTNLAKIEGLRINIFTPSFPATYSWGSKVGVLANLDKAHIDYLQAEYPAKYEVISQKISELKEKVVQCDPYNLLMHLRFAVLSHQINVFSESEYTKKFNAVLRSQEYVQSILVSTENHCIADHGISQGKEQSDDF